MIKPIMKDEAFLAIKSVPATKMDTQVAQDLKDIFHIFQFQNMIIIQPFCGKNVYNERNGTICRA